MSSPIISDVKWQVNVNQFGGVSGRNIIYTIKNPDGSQYRISRIFDVYSKAPEFKKGLRNTAVIESPPPASLPALNNYILQCEKNIGAKKFPNVNIHRCGALLSKTCITSAIKPPTITEQLKNSLKVQETEIQAIKKQIADLQVQVNRELADIVKNKEILARLIEEIKRLNALLGVN